MENKLETMVKYPDLELYVTWSALENSMRNMQEAIDSKDPLVITQKEIIEIRDSHNQIVKFN